MTGIDTNVLVRLFIDDNPEQTKAARRAVQALAEEEPGYISLVVLVELVWVLTRTYGLPAMEVTYAIEGLLETETFAIQNADQVYVAVQSAKSGVGAFADVLIGSLSEWAGCDTTLTFDVKASRLSNFTRL